MGDFLIYILKSSVCLILFYLFYRLLLSRDTFHRFNRIALLSVIALSILIPFIRIITETTVAIQRPLLDLESFLLMAQKYPGTSVEINKSIGLSVFFVIYLGGCIFFLIRFLYSTIQLYKLILRGEKQPLPTGCKLIITTKPISPFSWMRYVVISNTDMEENGKEILVHELAHIRALHSFDTLICNICIIFQWFNPAIWLLKQELQNVHEYEADDTVISQGIDAKKYQLLLIKKAIGPQRFISMVNSFSHSKLKKRITMMLKKKSNPWAKLKYLYVFPLTAIAVVAFARPEISDKLNELPGTKISKTVPHREVVISPPNKQALSSNLNKPLLIIDGKEVPYSVIADLDPNKIESISVLKDKNATEIYGEKGKNGVILVTSKHTSKKLKE